MFPRAFIMEECRFDIKSFSMIQDRYSIIKSSFHLPIAVCIIIHIAPIIHIDFYILRIIYFTSISETLNPFILIYKSAIHHHAIVRHNFYFIHSPRWYTAYWLIISFFFRDIYVTALSNLLSLLSWQRESALIWRINGGVKYLD